MAKIERALLSVSDKSGLVEFAKTLATAGVELISTGGTAKVLREAGLTVKDLEPMIGRSNRVYEILNRKRPLTLPMIRKLHDRLGIPAESLIRPSML